MNITILVLMFLLFFYDITYKFLKYMFVVNTVYDILINMNKNILL